MKTARAHPLENVAVFFDRDGVLIEMVKHGERYTAAWHLDEYKLIPGAAEGVNIVKELGFQAHVITNQPDTTDGLMTMEQLNLIHARLNSELNIDTITYCSLRDDPSYKPRTGMVDELCVKYSIVRSSSYLIGDSWKDIVCGEESGLTTIYVQNGPYCPPSQYADVQPDYIVSNVLEGCELIKLLEEE